MMEQQCFDTIFYGGAVRTMEDACSTAEALGIRGGQIAFVGSDREAEQLQAGERINLQGACVLPGFADGHMHLLSYAFVESSVKLFDCRSVEETLTRAAERLDGQTPFLYCRGWNEEHFMEKRYPTRQELDRICPERPVLFVRVCGHIGVCNTLALERIQALPQFKGMEDMLCGETGLVKEGVVQLFYHILEEPGRDYVERLLLLGMEHLNRVGVTGVQSDDFSSIPGANWPGIVDAYQSLERKQNMTVRVYEQCLFERISDFRSFLEKGFRTGAGGGFFRIGPLKLLCDGSLGAKTAALLEPYEGTDQKGLLLFSDQELLDIISLAQKNHMQIAAHCIGDRAMAQLMTALEAAQREHPREDCRHGIVHAQITSQAILDRMAANRLAAYIQPVFTAGDMYIAEERLGPRRLDKIYAWNTMNEKGILTVGGSDAPVESFDILENIYYAVTRQDKNGNPPGGWLPEERVCAYEAVKMFTVHPAESSFSEESHGTISLGKKADLVVLSADPVQADPEKIKDIRVLRTIVDGKTVFTNDN